MRSNSTLIKAIRTGLSLAVLGGALSACEDQAPTVVTVSSSTVYVEYPSDSAPSNAVCDPFGSAPLATPRNGLYGNLYYLLSGQPRPKNVAGYFANGTRADWDLYFNQLNVPTRPFDQGFTTQSGTLITTPSGDTLYEDFALDFQSELRLQPQNPEGRYQFAVLADDGAILRVNGQNGWQTLVNNDGAHPTKLGCSTTPFEMSRSTRLPIGLQYYQGPRYHIALILLWREIPANMSGENLAQFMNDPLCGRQGNDLFFNSKVSPSAPQQAWKDLLSRGWNVVHPDNYFLPSGVAENPCTGDCYTDRYQNPKGSMFSLSRSNVDSASVRVRVNGNQVAATYDPSLNAVYIPGFPIAQHNDVQIGYCQNGQTPGGTPTPTPSPSASPNPSPSPSVSPSPSPSPTPRPLPN